LFIRVVFIKFIPYGRQFIDENDIESVLKVLKSDFITQGPKIKEFEDALAAFCNAKYAVAFNSGTSALHGAYFALGIEKHDEIITSPNTFAATSNAALYLGAKPLFSDIDPKTGNLDINKLHDKINSKTKAVVPVHYSGNPVDMERLKEICQEKNINIIEDAAHALGAEYQGTKVGCCKYSQMSIFSFHPVKHITTGEGGAVLTNDKEYYQKLLMFRSHGITSESFENKPHGDWYYEMQHLGYNYRITDIQAVLGLSQLKKLEMFVKRRREIALKYDRAFDSNPYFESIQETPNSKSSYHLYPILLNERYKSLKSEIFRRFRESGLGVQVHYIPVYLHPYYKRLGYKPGLCPPSEDFYEKEISIPIYPSLTPEDQKDVIKRILNVFEDIEEVD